MPSGCKKGFNKCSAVLLLSSICFTMAACYIGTKFKTKYCEIDSLWCESRIIFFSPPSWNWSLWLTYVYQYLIPLWLSEKKLDSIFCLTTLCHPWLWNKDSTIELLARNGTSNIRHTYGFDIEKFFCIYINCYCCLILSRMFIMEK